MAWRTLLVDRIDALMPQPARLKRPLSRVLQGAKRKRTEPHLASPPIEHVRIDP